MAAPTKPAHVFGRDSEWGALASFTTQPQPYAAVGFVSGRARMGKTHLLSAFAAQYEGVYFSAQGGSAKEFLRQFEATVAAAPFEFANWGEAVTHLFELAQPGRPVPVVIDNVPELVRAVPDLPSQLERGFDRFEGESSTLRLLLCGPTSVSEALRRRSTLGLIVEPFGYLEAARFWGVQDDPALAVRLYSVLGGTPAYRNQFLAEDVPSSVADFDEWISRTVLSPLSPLFHEARYLLAEQPGFRTTEVNYSALAAVAGGASTEDGIAEYLGRQIVDIQPVLDELVHEQLSYVEDVCRTDRPRYRIIEPLLNLYFAVMRPAWSELESGRGREVWAEASQLISSLVVGPYFKDICRRYVVEMRAALGLQTYSVGRGVVQQGGSKFEVDVAVAEVARGRRSVVLLGDAEWDRELGVDRLERLDRARALLVESGRVTSSCVLACFSGVGFSDALRVIEGERDDVLLVSLADMYGRGAHAGG